MSPIIQIVYMHAKSLQLCLTLYNLWTGAHQAPLSLGFSRQENWSGLPCLPPGDLPNPGMEPESLTSPALTGGFFTTSATWEAHYIDYLQSNNNGQERRGALTEGAWHPLPPPAPAAVSSQALDVTHKSPASRQAKGPPLYRVRMRIQKGNILIRVGKRSMGKGRDPSHLIWSYSHHTDSGRANSP